jgi:hypothetical protein
LLDLLFTYKITLSTYIFLKHISTQTIFLDMAVDPNMPKVFHGPPL